MMTGGGGPQNMAAHHAAQMIHRSHATVQAVMMSNRRTRIFQVVPATPTEAPGTEQPPQTTSMGLEVAKTFTIYESEPVDGAVQYELLVDGESAWVGMGEDRADGLLKVIMRITGEDPEIPNN